MRRGTVVRGARLAVVLMAAGIAVAGALAPAIAGTAWSRSALVRVSSDPITKAGEEHATEAEPDTVAVGNMVLSSFMVGNVPALSSAGNDRRPPASLELTFGSPPTVGTLWGQPWGHDLGRSLDFSAGYAEMITRVSLALRERR